VDPVPDPLLFFSGSAGNRTRASESVAKNSEVEEGILLELKEQTVKRYKLLDGVIEALCSDFKARIYHFSVH
jgi:hypothetical protein